MASADYFIRAAPEEVFAVLADGWRYTNWVVGASHMRAVDGDWPAPGSTLHHASGLWPVLVRDVTVVDSVTPGRELVLTARGGLIGAAKIRLRLQPEGDGTRVSIEETPVAGWGARLHNPATDWLLRKRNIESLARLAALSERRESDPDDGPNGAQRG